MNVQTDRTRALIVSAVLGVAGLGLLVQAAPPGDPDGQMQLQELGRAPVVDSGRVKPLDTFARTQLMVISGKQTYLDARDQTQPAIRWLLDTMAAGLARRYQEPPAFATIKDPQLVSALGLSPRADHRYPVAAFAAKLTKRVEALEKVDPKGWDDEDRQAKELLDRLVAQVRRRRADADAIQKELDKRGAGKAQVVRIDNDQVLQMLGLKTRKGLRYSVAEVTGADGFQQFMQKADATAKRDEKTWDKVDGKSIEVRRRLGTYLELFSLGGALMVPPPAGAPPEEDWQVFGRALGSAERTGHEDPAAASLERVVRAYGLGKADEFNKEVADYRQMMEQRFPSESRGARLEVWFNHFAPFYVCMALYVLVFVILCLSWVTRSDAVASAAFWLAVVAVVIHTVALVLRMYLQGRPPVTNLYSSAVFIGWGCVLLCIGLEWGFRRLGSNLFGVALAVGTLLLGFPSLLIAHHLASSGDTLEMMQAVLDTNFWLATHVVCVTFGYTATFFAGAFGLVYLTLGVATTVLNRLGDRTNLLYDGPRFGRILGQVIYGGVCFATLLSFVGTVLGGIWADYSWGRFWGWDPKENGAVLIVIMNALILHARWGGMVKDRGMALLAVCGNMVTMWSWFGTNQLQIGLHSYGFDKRLVLMCTGFWISQALVLAVGVLPLSAWSPPPPPPGGRSGPPRPTPPGPADPTGIRLGRQPG